MVTSPQSPDLSGDEVRERLSLCTQDAVVDDLYSFGQKLADQALERVRSAEHKATFFAAYGSAVITLLASAFPKWADPGNRHTLWISVCISISAFLCIWFSVRVLRLRQIECTSEAEWLNKDCLDEPMKLKKYRILTLWETIDSRFKMQKHKAKDMQCAELSLAYSGLFLLYLLVQLAFFQIFGHFIAGHHWDEGWQFFAYWGIVGDVFAFLLLGGTLLRFVVSLWQIRVL